MAPSAVVRTRASHAIILAAGFAQTRLLGACATDAAATVPRSRDVSGESVSP
jgi:hypothetical protein